MKKGNKKTKVPKGVSKPLSKNFKHIITTKTKNPCVKVYHVTDDDDNGSLVLNGTIEDMRRWAQSRIADGVGDENEEMTVKDLEKDKNVFEYFRSWGFNVMEISSVTLKDFKKL